MPLNKNHFKFKLQHTIIAQRIVMLNIICIGICTQKIKGAATIEHLRMSILDYVTKQNLPGS